MRGAETMAWSRHQQVARGYLGNAPPPRIRFLRIVKNPTVETCYKHTYTRSRLVPFRRYTRRRPEPGRSGAFAEQNRGLFTYNIETRWLPGFARVPHYAPSPCHMYTPMP